MNQSKLDNSIAEVKTNIEAMNIRLNDTKEQISDLEDRIMEIIQSAQQTERKKKRKQYMSLWDNIKQASLIVIAIPEGKARETGIENVFEDLMAENFPN